MSQSDAPQARSTEEPSAGAGSGASSGSDNASSRNPLDILLNHVNTPGSTVASPTFLFLVDMCLFFLLFLFIGLLVMTRSLHFLALAAITLGLWGSVKLYVDELRKDNELRAAGAKLDADGNVIVEAKEKND